MNILWNTQMHWLTLVFILLELMLLLFYQLPHYLARPWDQQRFWFLILLLLLIHFNLWNGLLPDPKDFRIGIQWQYILLDGIAYLMGAYFPFYFYKSFGLDSLHFYATYGVMIFLLAPYSLFVGTYAADGQLAHDRHIYLVIPELYGLVVLAVIFRAIRKKYKQTSDKVAYLVEITALIAILPWEAMAVFAFRTPSQELRIASANFGLLVLAVIQMADTIRNSRLEYRELAKTDIGLTSYSEEKAALFEANCNLYELTTREKEIVLLLRQGLSNRQIAIRLFISGKTVGNHITHIYRKTGVSSRIKLFDKLGI